MVQRIPFGDHLPTVIKVFVDSNWAGCRKSRKPTSGGIIFFGDVAVRAWSGNQAVIALSSGEAEYYAALKGPSSVSWIPVYAKGLGTPCVYYPLHQ